VASENMDWHKYFIYDAETGNLIWKIRPADSFACKMAFKTWTKRFANKPCGNKRPRYDGKPAGIYVKKNAKLHLAHRIIWEMHFGLIPKGFLIDHKDCNPLNNKLNNLRLATRSQNNMNRRPDKDGTTGMKGVSRSSHAFVAYIGVNNKRIHLGSFPTKGLAAVARAKAAIRYHGKFARLT
jgi:hypothetical protein